jgi:hypothetical protein
MQQFRIFRALGLSFKAWFGNFIPFTLLAAVLYSPVVIWVLSYDPSRAENLDALMNAYFLRPIYVLAGLSTLLAPLITYRVVKDLNGTRVSLLTSVKFGLRGILPAIFFAVIINLVQLVPFVGSIIGIVMTCVWFVTTPAAVAERLGPFAAFSRSAQLTAGRRGGIFGLSLLIGLVMLAFLFLWIFPLFQHSGQDAAAVMSNAQRAAILFAVTMGVFQLFNGIVQAVAYALLRQDKDGVSYEELAKIFE